MGQRAAGGGFLFPHTHCMRVLLIFSSKCLQHSEKEHFPKCQTIPFNKNYHTWAWTLQCSIKRSQVYSISRFLLISLHNDKFNCNAILQLRLLTLVFWHRPTVSSFYFEVPTVTIPVVTVDEGLHVTNRRRTSSIAKIKRHLFLITVSTFKPCLGLCIKNFSSGFKAFHIFLMNMFL